MHSLEINFLKDREIRPSAATVTPRTPAPVGDRRPLVFGAVAALLLVGFTAAYWLVLKTQVAQLNERNAALDTELAELQRKLQEVKVLEAQIAAIKAENGAFIRVFNQILPWSAMLQDIRDRTPARVQIESIQQNAGQTPETEPDNPPPIAGGIEIQGLGCSFDDVNDFALVLQQSPFLDAGTVEVTNAAWPGDLLDPEQNGACPGSPASARETLVEYTLQANVTDSSASDLRDELERKGAVGLVARLRALEETGALDELPPPAAEAEADTPDGQE